MKRIIFCLLTFMVLSCSKTIEPSLGLYPVYFEVNLNTEWRLQASQASKIFTEKNTNQHDARFGLGGILVYNGFSNNGGSQNVYYAFDAACPYEASSNVTVEVQDGVLAIGTAVLTAVFHGVNAPFGRCCGGGTALTVHSVAAAGGFIHPMGGKEYAYGIF